MADDIPETARSELVRCLRHISTDDSGMDQEPACRRKNGKPPKSGNIRTVDSTIIKCITWPYELVYTSGGEPVTYDYISMSQFVTGYLCVLDMVKPGEKQCTLKHLKEMMVDASMYGW